MRRYGYLWPQVIAFTNLLRAACKARRRKRFRPDVARFHLDLEQELWALHEELASHTYRPGPYRTFTIHEPKERLISAAPYRDRVVHHALCNVLEPIFERSFLPDSYACRAGKGTHAAVRRCQHHARRFRYVLKADICKFFPSLDHQILEGTIARKIKDPDVRWLASLIVEHGSVPSWEGEAPAEPASSPARQEPRPPAPARQEPRPPASARQEPRPPASARQEPRPPASARQEPRPPASARQEPRPPASARQEPRPPASAHYLEHSNPQEPVCQWFAGDDLFSPMERRRGLPIGNQTSQFFANVYLDPLDHFVTDRLRVGGYVRYVDDFVMFAADKRRLAEVRGQVTEFLEGLRLRLHPAKTMILPTRQGIRFLGYRVFRSHLELVPENVWRFRRRLRRMQRQYARREITLAEALQRIQSWIGHARQADTYRLRERLLDEHPFRRATAV